jgi:ubiquitin-conjugating enzyme E2 O
VESDGADQPKLKTSKQDLSSKPSTRRRRKRFRHKRKQQLNSLKVKPGDRVCVEIIKTKTRADVVWQDGTLETNVDTLDLIAIYHIDDHQFFPGYIVNDKRGKTNTKPTLNNFIYTG